MNSENCEISDPHRLLLDLNRKYKFVDLSDLSIHYT